MTRKKQGGISLEVYSFKGEKKYYPQRDFSQKVNKKQQGEHRGTSLRWYLRMRCSRAQENEPFFGK